MKSKSELDKSNRVAVFVDIENFARYCAEINAPVDLGPVLKRIEDSHGRVLIARSYGDVSALGYFKGISFKVWEIRRMLQLNRVEHIDMPYRSNGFGKNSADIKLVVDAVSIVNQRPDITHIAVVSNDRDFLALFNYSREFGKTTVGIGPSRLMVNDEYANACDDFIYHTDLISIESGKAHDANAERVQFDKDASYTKDQLEFDASAALIAAIRETKFEYGDALATRVAQKLMDKYPNLDIKSNFGSFKVFCEHEERKGFITIAKASDASFYLFANDDNGQPPGEFLPNAVDEIGSSQRKQANEGDQLLLAYRDWIFNKMKIEIPHFEIRNEVFSAAAKVINESRPDGVQLKELGALCALSIEHKVNGAYNVAYRLLYGAYIARAFECVKLDDVFNPIIKDYAKSEQTLDECFISGLLYGFNVDKKRGVCSLPLDERLFRSLFFAGESEFLVQPGQSTG